MAWSLSGNSLSFSFSTHHVDVVGWHQPTNVPQQKVDGSDGVEVDTAAISLGPMEILMEGFLVASSYANLKTAENNLADILNSTPNALSLTDGTLTASVRKTSYRVARPAGVNSLRVNVAITFIAESGDWS